MEKLKNFIKGNKIVICIAMAVLIVIGIIAFFLMRDTSTFLTITDNLLSQRTGDFRYVIDVRTNAHKEGGTDSFVEDKSDLENIEANADVDAILDEYLKDEKDFEDWGNKHDVEVTDWSYPKYKVILEGCVVTTEPLEMSLTISVATNYFNDTFTEIIVKDNKTYVNIEQLRYWLVSSKDMYLKNLGETLPDGTKYVSFTGDAFNLYSTFAESNEVDVSRVSDLNLLYSRLLSSLDFMVNSLDLDDSCLDNNGGTYTLNITGDNSIKLLESLKSSILDIGDNYEYIVNSNNDSGLYLSDEQYNQALAEKDNVVDAFSDMISYLNTADLKAMDLRASGNALVYTGGKGQDVYESVLAFQFTAENIDYSVAIQLYKTTTYDRVVAPTASINDVSHYTDTDFIQKYIVDILEYFNITGVDLFNRLNLNVDSITDNVLEDFADMVNTVNKDNEDFTPITKYGVVTFIDKYRNYTVTNSSSELDKINSELVQSFLTDFDFFVYEFSEQEDTDKDLKDESRYSSVVYENDSFRIYADFDTENSNTKCAVVDCYILNKTGEELVLNVNDFTLQTMLSNKYPANYKDLIFEYDNSFDFTLAPESVTLSGNGYAKVQMYFILANGLEYLDLWYLDEKVGVVVNY